MPRIGVLGALVWDEIHGRDPMAAPVEEWGGIAYALAAMDAALPPDWELVPLIKLGADLAAPGAEFLGTLERLTPGGRCITVPVANNRVTLRYLDTVRRCERMSGGVPPWTWPELGPMVRDLDALYVNFISGFEMSLGTAEALRRGFNGPIYVDLHSLFLAMGADGMRAIRPLPDAPSWFSCFDVVQMNDEELQQLDDDPLVVAADAIRAGVSLLNVTMGSRGVVYFARPGFDGIIDISGGTHAVPLSTAATIRTERVAAPATEGSDPTGCGDVFGATCCARLLAGDTLLTALGAANTAASRNANFRGAGGLARYLRGDMVLA
jgi:hypothetical protein